MKFTWFLVLGLIAVGASAQSFDSGFGLNGFNNLNGRCDNGFGVQSPVIETSSIRIPGFVSPAVSQQTCDCVKTIIRPEVRKEIITIPSVQRFFQTTNPILQTIPFVERNIHLPPFPLPSPKMFTEVIPAPIVGARNRVFPGKAVNIGCSIPRPISGNFQGILNGAFLGNSLGTGPELVGSFPGTIGAGFGAGGSGVALPGSSVVGGGFANGELSNNC